MTLPPITPDQAERNASLLDAEVRAYEIGHGQHMHGMKRATTRPGQPQQPGPCTSTLPPITPQQAAANRALLESELREYARRHRARRGLEPCGTTAAYRRHERDGDVTCQPCCDAHADAEWERARQRRGVLAIVTRRDEVAQRHAGYAWLRDGHRSPAEAAARVGIRSRHSRQAYEREYQEQRAGQQQEVA